MCLKLEKHKIMIDVELKMRYFEQFCDSNYDNLYNNCDKMGKYFDINMRATKFILAKDNRHTNYEKINLIELWKEYCYFRLNFFEIDLPIALGLPPHSHSHSHSQSQSQSQLLKLFSFARNQCGFIISNKMDEVKIKEYRFIVKNLLSQESQQSQLQQAFLSLNEINIELLYYYIWNAMYGLFYPPMQGFNTNFGMRKSLSVSNFVKREIFDSIFNKLIAQDSVARSEFYNNQKEYIKLIEYCMQDINNDINGFEKHHLYFLLNRLTFVLFNVLKHNRNYNKNNLNGLIFKGLNKVFFPFLWNYCIYHACFISEGTMKRLNAQEKGTIESFVISQYFLLKQTYNNNNNNNNDNNNNSNSKHLINLTELDITMQNLQGSAENSGTLLYRTGRCGMAYYCEVLLNDGAKIVELNSSSIKTKVLDTFQKFKKKRTKTKNQVL